jgi:hypothetical protein
MRDALRFAFVIALTTGAAAGLARAQCDDDDEFTTEFRFEDCTFADSGRNPYFSLDPGDKLVFDEDAADGVHLEITVLGERRWVQFEAASGKNLWVRTRIVEEREWEDGELVEVSRNFFARCKQTNDVFYFGEQTIKNGVIAPDSWEAGVNDALPGLIMPGTFLLGSKYFQEQAPGAALDRADHVGMGEEVALPAGTFEDCVVIEETNALDCDSEGDEKVYCPGIGLVIDGDAQLTEYDLGDDDDEHDDRGRGGRGR